MRRVPLRRSLLVRLLASAVLIAVCSIAATAWLAVQGTSQAIQRAQGQELSNDARIYDTLLKYAATHPAWTGVSATVAKLRKTTGREITLTTRDRTVIARSAVGASLAGGPAAVVDPLQTDPALQPGTTERIDPRALGPYRLTAAKADYEQALARKVGGCLSIYDKDASLVRDLAGYMSIDLGRSAKAQDDPQLLDKLAVSCLGEELARPSAAERRALAALDGTIQGCLRKIGRTGIRLRGPADSPLPAASMFSGDDDVQECVDAGRRRQLKPYVAPAALLFVGAGGDVPSARFELSRRNLLRIAGAAGLVLLVTVAVTALVGARLVRPLRALTAAASDPAVANLRVPVTGKDEIGVLAVALNGLSDRRERAEQQRTAMVSDVAHELRTPLTNIRSWLEAVEDGLASPLTDPAMTGALLREARQLQHIIDDLQDLATADAGGLRLDPSRIPLDRLLDDVVAAHRGSAESAGVRLSARAEGPVAVDADPVRLRQALGNLVSNAIRYTPRKGRVALIARAEAEGVVITVSDTGSGIEPGDLPYVFDRFWRADRSRSRDTGGSGLGLAIVRQIVTAHDGTIEVSSTPGMGTTFTIRL